jgi:hypothetical protein
LNRSLSRGRHRPLPAGTANQPLLQAVIDVALHDADRASQFSYTKIFGKPGRHNRPLGGVDRFAVTPGGDSRPGNALFGAVKVRHAPDFGPFFV